MSDMCDYPMCTGPIINGVPLCHHSPTTQLLEALATKRDTEQAARLRDLLAGERK